MNNFGFTLKRRFFYLTSNIVNVTKAQQSAFSIIIPTIVWDKVFNYFVFRAAGQEIKSYNAENVYYKFLEVYVFASRI